MTLQTAAILATIAMQLSTTAIALAIIVPSIFRRRRARWRARLIAIRDNAPRAATSPP